MKKLFIFVLISTFCYNTFADHAIADTNFFEQSDFVEFVPIAKPKETEPNTDELTIQLEQTETIETFTDEQKTESTEVVADQDLQTETFATEITENKTDTEKSRKQENQLEKIETIETIITERNTSKTENTEDKTETEPSLTNEITTDENQEYTQNEENTEEPLVYEQTNQTYNFEKPDKYRTVNLNKNQFLLIEYPSFNWLFLGDEFNSDCVAFSNRELTPNSTLFKIKTLDSGEAFLHFLKHDQLTDTKIEDYILISVSNNNGNFEQIKIEEEFTSQPAIITMVEAQNENDTILNSTIIEEEPEIVMFEDSFLETENEEIKTADELLTNVQNSLTEKDYATSLLELETFSKNYSETDLSLLLKAQVFEAKSEYQDIKKAVLLYDELTNKYPASQYWEQANQRKIYLEKFYLK